MKKKYCIILLICSVTLICRGQGINFVFSYAEAVEKAAKDEKQIFIDFYTPWCAPCKIMDKEIFSRKDVGEFFNRNYIALKIDAETPEGRKLAKKFDISSFPTFVFLDQQGNFLGKDFGLKSNNELIKLAQNCADTTMAQINEMRIKYESGTMTSPEILEYIRALRQSSLSALQPLESWMKMLAPEELFSLVTYQEISKESFAPGDYPFDFLLEHYSTFTGIVDKTRLDQYLYLNCMFLFYQNSWVNIDNTYLIQKLENQKIYFIPALKEQFDLVKNVLPDPERDEELIRRTRKLVADYPVSGPSIGNEILKYAWGSRNKAESYMDELAEKVLAYHRNSAVQLALAYVGVYLQLQAFEKANVWVDHYMEWSGDPEYWKDLTLYVKRTLGFEKCAGYGKEMYPFTLPDLKSKMIALTDFRGGYVLLDFWASWCGPCKGELPYLKAIAEKYQKKGLVVISITCDKKKEDWQKVVEQEGMTWIQLSSDQTDVNERYGVEGIPRIMLLDKDGKLVADELRGEYIEKSIKREMKQ